MLTEVITNNLEHFGTDACVRQLASRIPQNANRLECMSMLLSGDAVDNLKPRTGSNAGDQGRAWDSLSMKTGERNSELKLERLAQCCVAERYSQKYDTSIYLASTNQNEQRFFDTIRQHLSNDEACGFVISSYTDFDGIPEGGEHSVILAAVPDRQTGTCNMIFSDSIGGSVCAGLTPYYVDELIEVSRGEGLEARWYRTGDQRQADAHSCHTDALHSLKEILRDDAHLGRAIPSCNIRPATASLADLLELMHERSQYQMDNTFTEYQFTVPPGLLKTAQISAYLDQNGFDGSAQYREQKTIGDHRVNHTFPTRYRGDAEFMARGTQQRNTFVASKTIQYADVAVSHLFSGGAQNFEAAALEVQSRRDLTTGTPSESSQSDTDQSDQEGRPIA